MNTQNLTSFFQLSEINISDLIGEPNILAIHILHMYYYIKEWYKNNEYRKLVLDNDIIKNRDYINNNITKTNICNLTTCSYISIIYNETSICSSITTPLLDYIHQLYQKNILYYAIYITLRDNSYIIFNYDYHKKILLIDISTLNLIEFNSIQECIESLEKIKGNTYIYQILRIARRLYSFDSNKPEKK